MPVPSKYKPENFHDVTTYLVVRRGHADSLIAFLQAAFAAVEVLVMRDPDGRVAHAQFSIGDSMIEFGEGNGDWFSQVGLHYYVEDVDTVHARAIAAGGRQLGEPVDHDYGERSSTIEDPCGNHWYIARLIA